MTELLDEVVASCCLPGGACHEAGLSRISYEDFEKLAETNA